MLQSQADISTLSARALGRWSAIGYSVKTGRLEVFIPDVPQHIEVKRLGGKKLPDLKPGDGNLDLTPGDGKPGLGGRRGRSIGAARSGVVEFWFPGDKKPHFRCPPGTRRAGKWTDEMGTDCNLGGARAALSRIGQRLDRMARGEPGRGDLPSVGRRLEVAKERAASKLDYDDPQNTLAAIEAQKRAKKIAKELEKAKKAKLDGSKKPQRKPRVTPSTSREDSDILKALEEKLKPYGKPGRKLTDAELEKLKEDALVKRKPGKNLKPYTFPSEADRDAWRNEARAALEKKLGRKVTDEELDAAIGRDLIVMRRREYGYGYDPSLENPPPMASMLGLSLPNAGFSESVLEEWASKLDYDDPDNKLKPKAPKKPRKKRDMAATLEAAASKLDYDDPQNALKPKKKRKGKGKRTDVAAKLDEAASALDYDDPQNALKPKKPKDEGELPKPKRTLLQRLKDRKNRKKSPKATAMEAVADDAGMRPGKAPTPEVTPEAPKKPKAGKAGKQFGNAFSSEKNVKSKAMTLALDEGQTMYVVQDDKGKFRIMDEERFLATDGATPYAIFGPDGQPVDLPEMADDAPDEIVDDVQKIVEAIPEDLAADAKALDVPKGDTTLELSKTGAFLPPDLTPEMLQELGSTKNDDFFTAFELQRAEIRDYWNSRVDLDKAESFDDALQRIDAHIAKRTADGASQKELGQLRAERKNFLAAWMPDETGEVDPYARVNFLQPKRRTALIEKAGIGDLVVGKKAAKKKVDVPDEQTPDLPALGQADVEPEGDKWAAQLRAIQVEKKAEYDKNVELLEQYFDDAGSEFPVDYLEKMLENNDSVLEAYKSSYDANPDAALMEVNKNDLALILARRKVIKDRIAKLKGETPEDVAPDEVATPEPDVPSVMKPKSMPSESTWASMLTKDASDDIAKRTDALKDSSDAPQLADFKNEDGTHDHQQLMATFDQAEDNYSKVLATLYAKDELDDDDYAAFVDAVAQVRHAQSIQLEGILQDEEANAAKALETVDFVDVATPNADKTPDEIYNAIAEQIVADPSVKDMVDTLYENSTSTWSETMTPEQVKDAHLKAAQLYLAQADQRKLFLMEDLKNWGTEPTSDDVAIEQQYRQLAKRMLEEAAKIDTDAEPGSAADKAKASEGHAISAVFGKNPITNASGTEIFDPQKLIDYETQKFSGDLAGAQARATKYDDDYKKIQAVIGQSSFSTLAPQEQRAKLREALGVNDDYELAKKVGRAYATQQYGTRDSLDALSVATAGFSVASEPDVDKMAAAATAADEARQRLATAEARLALLTPDDSPIAKMIIEADIEDARVQLATHLITQLKHADVANLVGTDETNEDYLEKIGTAFSSIEGLTEQSEKLSSMLRSRDLGNIGGMELKSHTPKTSADGMPNIADDFDASLLGSIGSSDGKAIAVTVPIGNKGIYSKKQAVSHVAKGGKLSDVPDMHLKEAIWENTGPGKRFKIIQEGVKEGYNNIGAEERDKTTGFQDTLTGKRYVLKSPYRNDQEYVQELAGARVMQVLGFATPGIRVAGPIEMKKSKDGTMSPQAPILMEDVRNLYGVDSIIEIGNIDSDDVVDVMDNLSPESFAAMVVLDRAINYYDRTSGNYFLVKAPDGTMHVQPIDHGNGFTPFPSGLSAEQQLGMTATVKSDNITPAFIAQAEFTTPEQKRAYGVAMMEAIRRYKGADWRATMKEIADRQDLSPEARKKLEQHGEYLEQRKEDLDWDTMTQTALLDLGLSVSEIDDIRDEVDSKYASYRPPSDAETPAQAGEIAAKQAPMNFGTNFSYDGEDIEDFAVNVSGGVVVKGMTDADGQPYVGNITQMEFKLHGKAREFDPTTTPGWEKLSDGHPVATQSPIAGVDSDRDMTWNFESLLQDPITGLASYAPGSGDAKPSKNVALSEQTWHVETWARRMPDGTIVMVTRPTGYGNSANNLIGVVRVVSPGKPDAVMADAERIREYMSAAGVQSHIQPGEKEFEQVGIRKMGRMLLGSAADSYSYDELVERLGEKGFSSEDIRIYRLHDGRVSVGLTLEATDRALEETGVARHVHTINYLSSSDGEIASRIEDMIVIGALGSTQVRFSGGIFREGASSNDDATMYGSGNYLFMSPQRDNNLTGYSSFRVYYPPEVITSRTDWYGTTSDAYGAMGDRLPPISKDVHVGTYGSNPETMVKGTLSVADGIIVVPDDMRQSILDKIKARGVTEVDGVPIEKILVGPGDADARFQELQAEVRERMKA